MQGMQEQFPVTLLVMSTFSGLPGTSMGYLDFRNPTDLYRFNVSMSSICAPPTNVLMFIH